MIFVCNHCDTEMKELRTPGTGIDHSLICPNCSRDLNELLKKAREIQHYLMAHFKRLP